MGAGRRRCAWCVISAALVLCAAGCRGPGGPAPDYARRHLHVSALRDQLWSGEVGRTTRQPEDAPSNLQQAAHRQPATLIAVRRLHAEIFGDPTLPGRSIQLRLQPRDADGRATPVTANLRVGLVLSSPDSGGARLLGSWDFSADQLSGCWDVQWGGAGYTVMLPPQTLPSEGSVRVVARMTLADHSRLEGIVELPRRAQSRQPVPVAGETSPEGLRPAAAWEPPPLRQAFKLLPPVPLD